MSDFLLEEMLLTYFHNEIESQSTGYSDTFSFAYKILDIPKFNDKKTPWENCFKSEMKKHLFTYLLPQINELKKNWGKKLMFNVDTSSFSITSKPDSTHYLIVRINIYSNFT